LITIVGARGCERTGKPAAAAGTAIASFGGCITMRTKALVLVAATLFTGAAAEAQLVLVEHAIGLSAPVAIVQDPTDVRVQFILEQAGRIRVSRSGVVQPGDFLDIRPLVLSGGERGLLGIALAPDYAASGRFYINYTRAADGHTVISRYKRSSGDPLVADPASRKDLVWSTGLAYIEQTFSNHNGGCLAFGADGYLYIAMGDGGAGNDPMHLAQDPTSLLGKVLRIDVSVADGDAAGFRVPANNPFLGAGPAGTRPEIWSFGWRNPWRFSFDDPARGGTGAMVTGDVGQGSWEEVNYEPQGRGGRNYGWRNREGAHPNVQDRPPAFLPLTDPIHEYSHAVGGSITGGVVYRGSIPELRGRYFFADFVTGRLWSFRVQVDPSTQEGQAADLQEHTNQLSSTGRIGNISAFGVDGSGELLIVDYSRGIVYRLMRVPGSPTNLRIIR
jgi:glucose/arabinose dehydrogenase